MRLIRHSGTLKSNEPVLTVGSGWPYATTVWDYTRRAMPYQLPGRLTADETYALTKTLRLWVRRKTYRASCNG